jgi:heme exporter protein A
MWLRGQNGQGKTSLLRLMVGLSEPDQGRLTWGKSSPTSHPGTQGDVVYVGHANALKDDLTVIESLRFLACLHGRDDSPQALTHALQRLGMVARAKSPVRTLSQGQRRRVALARLVLERSPLLWVLDEPFDALDAGGVDVVNALLREHVARQGSVFLTSHVPLSLDSSLVTPLDLQQGCAR